MKSKITTLACAVVATVACASPSHAGLVVIGGGWQAEWAAALDPYVSINSLGVEGDAVFIQKSAEFLGAPVNGIFPSIDILFRQIAPTAVHNIVIDDEIITNSTGSAWTGFNMDVIGGGAVFDPVATLNSGGGGPLGFSIAPFTTAAFQNANTRFAIGGGTVANGGVWFPGDGATDGQLWINIANPTGETVFTLRETPTPAPGALALLLTAGLLAGSRRRRA